MRIDKCITLKIFYEVRGQTVETRKKRVKECFLNFLCFRDIIAQRNLDDPGDASGRAKKKKDLYNRLDKFFDNDDRDMEFWRTSEYEIICVETCKGRLV